MIILILRFSIQKRTYSNEEYFALKEYFKQIVIAENADIVLEKNVK